MSNAIARMIDALRDLNGTAGFRVCRDCSFFNKKGAAGQCGLPVIDEVVSDERSANVIDFASASARINKRRTWRVGLAAAVATAAITIPIVSSLSGSSPSIAALAKRVASQSSSRSLTLKSEDGSELAKVVVGKDGQGYLTSDSLPKLGGDKAYQLWAVTKSGPVSLGILGSDPSVQAFATPSTYAALAISVEDSAGAAAPTPPIASAAV